jgi:NAD(P)-dependent dehydrogenase (short-subunit alcohol dehydrogenase family)
MGGLLKDRVVLVTGALGSIGQAISSTIEREDGHVLRSDLAGSTGIDLALDVTDEAAWIAAAHEIERRHGRLDGLVNNAGIGFTGTVEATPLAQWRRVMGVNADGVADGVFLGCHHMLPLLRRAPAPSIVNMSSVAGLIGTYNLAAYCASKGAVRMFTKSLALSGARMTPKVRCNSVHPSFVAGAMVDNMLAQASDPDQLLATMQSRIPMGRLAAAAEVAEMVVWLLSDRSAFTTGAEMIVDGGVTAGR